jgi:hypothetical protein
MGFWLIAALIFGGALIAGLATPRRTTSKRSAPPEPRDEEELWTADTLARLGTPDTVADLVAQGRADELRGLGYSGKLPPEA